MTKRRTAWLLFAISIAVGCASTGPGELTPLGDDRSPPGNANGPPGNPNGPAPNPNGAPCTGSTTAEELFQIASDAICAHAAACGDTGSGGGGGQGGGDGGFGGEGNFGGTDFGGAAGFQGDWAPGAGKSLTVQKLVDKLLSYKGQPPLQTTFAEGDNGGGFGWGAMCALFSGLIEECKAHPTECEIEGPAVIPVCASSVQACMQAIFALIPCDPAQAEDFELTTLPPACAGLGGTFGGEGGSGGQGGSGGAGGAGGFGGGGTCEYPNCGGCADTCSTCVCAAQGNQSQCTAVCGGGGMGATGGGGVGATGGFGATGGVGATGGIGGMDGGDCVNPTCTCPDACTTCMCIYNDTTFCATYCG